MPYQKPSAPHLTGSTRQGEQEHPDTTKVRVLQIILLDLVRMTLEGDIQAKSPRATLAFRLYWDEFEMLCGSASAADWVKEAALFNYLERTMKDQRDQIREKVQSKIKKERRMSFDLFRELFLKFFGGL